MGRAPCCDKANVKKGPWSPEEDSKLKSYIEQNGTGGNWIALPQKIGLRRCGKSCRLRWLNYLRPNIKHGGFSEEEDNIICSLYMSIGSRWSIIAAQLPGRTDNDIKNYWNTRLKKKLLGKQRKEQQSLVRRMNSLKQEKKNENPYENLVLPNIINQAQYWSNQPVAAPMVNSNQDPCLKDQTSLRNLLIKLGGRFSDPYPITNSLNQDFQSLTQFPTAQYDVNSSTPAMFQPTELELDVDELSYRNSVQYDRFDGFYGMEMIGSTSATNSGESSSWSEEMKAFVDPLMVSDYEACQHAIPHLDSAFELGFQ